MEAEKVIKRGEDLFFFFFFFFSLLKTTEICVGSTKMEIFYREKAFHAGKKIRKNNCYAPAQAEKKGGPKKHITGSFAILSDPTDSSIGL